MIRARALIVTAALLAAACAPSATTAAPDGTAPGGVNGTQNLPNNEIVDPNPNNMPANAEEATARDTCSMARFRHLIGTNASAIDRSTLPTATRVITPDMMVTQDFSPQRLNIMVGSDGKVSSMRCF